MIESRIQAEKPYDIRLALQVTMTIEQWERLKDQLARATFDAGRGTHEVTTLKSHISKLVERAHEHFTESTSNAGMGRG